MKMKNINLKNNKRGFTLFVAMIVSGLLLAVGFSIGNIILKQLILSGSSKDSQISFYAASSGAECAQFWDDKYSNGDSIYEDGPFATSTPLDDTSIRCGVGPVKAFKTSFDNITATSTLIIDYSMPVNYIGFSQESYRACAQVEIVKGFETIGEENIPYTKISSRGYNSKRSSNGLSCETSNPRTVERGVFVQY
jgi:hypothetical protein